MGLHHPCAPGTVRPLLCASLKPGAECQGRRPAPKGSALQALVLTLLWDLERTQGEAWLRRAASTHAGGSPALQLSLGRPEERWPLPHPGPTASPGHLLTPLHPNCLYPTPHPTPSVKPPTVSLSWVPPTPRAYSLRQAWMPPAQYLSNSKVGIADFAQVCLGAQQESRQLGLGKARSCRSWDAFRGG